MVYYRRPGLDPGPISIQRESSHADYGFRVRPGTTVAIIGGAIFARSPLVPDSNLRRNDEISCTPLSKLICVYLCHGSPLKLADNVRIGH